MSDRISLLELRRFNAQRTWVLGDSAFQDAVEALIDVVEAVTSPDLVLLERSPNPDATDEANLRAETAARNVREAVKRFV